MTSKEFRVLLTLGTAAFLFLFVLIAFDVNIDLTPGPAQAATYTLRPTFYGLAQSAYTDTIPGLLSYQGTLADGNGDPIDGNVEMTFRIYTTTVGGTPLYTETHPAVVVRAGDFAVLLGQTTPFPDGLFAEPNRYLGLQVGAQAEMSPRQRFASVAFALWSRNVPDGSITTAKLESHLCCGHTNTDGTGWVNYAGGEGAQITVDTSACNFSDTPMYFTSLAGGPAGGSGIWKTSGATSIYATSTDSFYVILYGVDVTIDAAYAQSNDWYIQWCGVNR